MSLSDDRAVGSYTGGTRTRANDGVEVTLLWVRGGREDEAVVCGCAGRKGACVSIRAEPCLALDVYYPPVRLQGLEHRRRRDSRLAA
jgi:hypothetical protein